MRLIPDSMAGRVALALIAGVVVILGIGVGVATSDLLGDPPPVRRAEAVSRLAAVVDTVRRLPPEMRAEAARGYGGPGFDAAWLPPEAEPPAPVPDHDSRQLEWRLRRLAPLRGVRPVDLGGLPPGVVSLPGLAGDDVLYGRVGLRDGSWISLRIERDWHHSTRLLQLLVTLAIVGSGLAILALLLARWMTAPLGRFAEAATRLGADVAAPPMVESGPVEIRKAAHAFNEMQRRIRRFIDERMHMIAAASHDLRTPITRLKLRAEFIEDEELRAKFVRDLDEMEAVIASTMELAREETSREPPQDIDLALLMREIASEFGEAGGQVECVAAGQVPVRGRYVALKRAFTNLVRNALSYGHEARIQVDRQDRWVVIRVDDRGPGIPEQERERVFAPFYTLEPSRSRQTGGTGLGLSIARAIIRAHGGEIDLSDVPGDRGLRQTIRLPAADATGVDGDVLNPGAASGRESCHQGRESADGAPPAARGLRHWR